MATEINRIIQELIVDDAQATGPTARYRESLERLKQTADLTEDELKKLQEETARSGQKTVSAARAYDNMQSRIDSTHRATREFRRDVDTTNRALRQGIITKEEAADSSRR